MQKRKVLFFSNQGLGPLHLGIELELIQRELDTQSEVHIMQCNNCLNSCFFNPTHNLVGCAICQSRSNAFYNDMNVQVHSLKNIKSNRVFPYFHTMKELIDYEVNGLNIGRGVASSIISIFREYKADQIKNFNEISKVKLEMCLSVIENFKSFMKDNAINEVYVFNGRFAEEYAVILLCEDLGIDYTTFERGRLKTKYRTAKNSLILNISNFHGTQANFEQSIPSEVIREEAERWLNKRSEDTSPTAVNFTKLMEIGKLPKGFEKDKVNVAIFSSSEDEMKTIRDWQFGVYDNQNDAVQKIAKDFLSKTNFQFYFRLHPSLTNLNNTQVNEATKLNYPNLHVIRPEENVDTYALIKASSKIITFGSTVGVEATYAGKPSILFGSGFYKGLGCCYEPQSYKDLYTLLENLKLKPKNKTSVYSFIYTLLNRGKDLKYFSYEDKNNASFNSRRMKRVSWSTIKYLIKYSKNYKLWNSLNRLIFEKPVFPNYLIKLRSHKFDKTFR